MKKQYFLLISTFLMLQFSFSQKRLVSDVIIKGNRKIKTSFLHKILKVKNGQTLDSIKLKEDITVLKRLPSVAHAYYQVLPKNISSYNVVIHIEEKFTIIPDVSFWSATNNVFAYKLGLYEYNFLGRNIKIGGYYQNNGYDTFEFNFKAPNLFSKKLGLEVNFNNWKSEEPLFFDNQTANYLYNNISTEVLALYQANFKNQFSFGFNIFKEKYSYLFGAKKEGIPLNLNVDKKLFKLVYVYNNLEYYYQYISGFKSEFYGQYVISDNNFQETFLIAWNDFLYFKRVKNKGNWANRLRVGLATNNDSPFAPFALDNNVNIRGVGILVDRGTGSIVLNSEYRYTVYDKNKIVMQSNVFLDAGSWRNPGGKLNDFTKFDNMRLYSGLGLRFISKKIYNATFRIDYGYSFEEKRGGFVFGLGQYF